jgi:GDPmannose 4,6-dehydratase
MKKKALITGIGGQDGSYLAELLLSKGYAVHGTVLPIEMEDPQKYLWRIADIKGQIELYPINIENYQGVKNLIKDIRPDECYHLAACSFVSYSFEEEFSVFKTNLEGTHQLLAACKQHAPDCRVYFAASSEIFGQAPKAPQDENTPMNPRSIYGITKAAGYQLVKYYRQQHGLYACSGIAYNHESPRRGVEYVTHKITMGATRIKLGLQKELRLGNLDAQRDWGYAPDYVHAMWLMLNQDEPDDFVLATGVLNTVRELCQAAFSHLELDYQEYVQVDPEFFRPDEKIPLVGNPSKAAKILNWEPNTSFDNIVSFMVKQDFEKLTKRNK